MANPFLIQAVTGFISLGLFGVSIAVFTKVVLHLMREGGKVRTSDFQLPEGLMALVLGSFFVGLMVNAIRRGGGQDQALTIEQVIPSASIFLVFAAGIAAFLKFLRQMRLRQVFGFTRLSLGKSIAWAAGLLVCAYPLTGVAALLSQKALKKEDLAQQALVQLFRDVASHNNYAAIAKILVAAVMLAPLCEEFFFRGFFYGVGKRFLGPVPAGILSAFLFAACHLNLGGLGVLFVLAVCFTLAYERTGSLLVPMLMHSTFNFMSLLMIFAQAKGWLPVPQ